MVMKEMSMGDNKLLEENSKHILLLNEVSPEEHYDLAIGEFLLNLKLNSWVSSE